MSEYTDFYVGLFTRMQQSEKRYGTSADTDAWIAAVSRENAQHITRTEVALSDDLSASFHREAMSLSLVSEHCVILLDRAETYRLLSLLEAEFKGMVS